MAEGGGMPKASAPVSVPAAGTVYGVLLNHAADVDALTPAELAHHKAPPKAPVLYLKPANTRVANGARVTLPAGATAVEAGATIGLVLGAPACRLEAATALQAVAGLVLVLDLGLPQPDILRPPIREKCFDGACPIGTMVVPPGALPPIESLRVRTTVDGHEAIETRFDALVRTPGRLLADVTAFMTLLPGDVLLLGAPRRLPLAPAGATVVAEADGLGRLEVSLVAEAAA